MDYSEAVKFLRQTYDDPGIVEVVDRASAANSTAPMQPTPGFVLVPTVPTLEMELVMAEENWLWSEVLAAAGTATEAEIAATPMQPSELARAFHEAYERLAPSFSYETKPGTRVFDPTSANGRLMIAVCAKLSNELRGSCAPSLAQQTNGVRTHGRSTEDGDRGSCQESTGGERADVRDAACPSDAEPSARLRDSEKVDLVAAPHGVALAAPTQAGGEAVAVIGRDFHLLYAGRDAVSDIVKRHGLKVGSYLYAAAPAAAVEPRTTPPCRDCADFGPICPSSGQPCDKRAAAAPEAPTEDNQWIAEAKKTLDRLSAFLQAFDVPHAVNWRDWIDNAEKHFTALRPATPDAKTAEARKETPNE